MTVQSLDHVSIQIDEYRVLCIFGGDDNCLEVFARVAGPGFASLSPGFGDAAVADIHNLYDWLYDYSKLDCQTIKRKKCEIQQAWDRLCSAMA